MYIKVGHVAGLILPPASHAFDSNVGNATVDRVYETGQDGSSFNPSEVAEGVMLAPCRHRC